MAEPKKEVKKTKETKVVASAVKASFHPGSGEDIITKSRKNREAKYGL